MIKNPDISMGTGMIYCNDLVKLKEAVYSIFINFGIIIVSGKYQY